MSSNLCFVSVKLVFLLSVVTRNMTLGQFHTLIWNLRQFFCALGQTFMPQKASQKLGAEHEPVYEIDP